MSVDVAAIIERMRAADRAWSAALEAFASEARAASGPDAATGRGARDLVSSLIVSPEREQDSDGD